MNDLEKIRNRFEDLKALADITPELMLAHLLSIVKDAERHRVSELKAADEHERLALASRVKAEGFATMSAIVYNVVNGFVGGAEASQREAEDMAKEAEAQKKLDQKMKRRKKK